MRSRTCSRSSRAITPASAIPGGFHLTSTAGERVWATPSGKANFLLFDGLGEDLPQNDPEALWLTTVRSHDQYNTTLYSMSDRYRGVYGQRDVVFLNEREMTRRGLASGDRVDLVTLSTDGVERAVRNFQVVGCLFPDGCCAAYYPETNPLMPLYAYDPVSFTPSGKAVPIRIVRAAPDRPDSAAGTRCSRSFEEAGGPIRNTSEWPGC